MVSQCFLHSWENNQETQPPLNWSSQLVRYGCIYGAQSDHWRVIHVTQDAKLNHKNMVGRCWSSPVAQQNFAPIRSLYWTRVWNFGGLVKSSLETAIFSFPSKPLDIFVHVLFVFPRVFPNEKTHVFMFFQCLEYFTGSNLCGWWLVVTDELIYIYTHYIIWCTCIYIYKYIYGYCNDWWDGFAGQWWISLLDHLYPFDKSTINIFIDRWRYGSWLVVLLLVNGDHVCWRLTPTSKMYKWSVINLALKINPIFSD